MFGTTQVVGGIGTRSVAACAIPMTVNRVENAEANSSLVNIMRMSFKCSCGRRLKARLNVIGKRLPCPACNNVISIPFPSISLIRNFFDVRCSPIPNLSASNYDKMIELIRDLASLAAKLTPKNSKDENSILNLVDDSKRNLRNISVFVNDIADDAYGKTPTDPAIASGLSQMARGSNYGGIGTSETKRRQYCRWQTNHGGTDVPIENHALHYKALNELKKIELKENGG